MIKITAFLISSFLALPAFAQVTNMGRNPKAIASKTFDCRAYKKHLEGVHRYAFGFLWHTFGNDLICAEAEIADPRVWVVIPELLNETCVSRGDCGKYEILHGLTTQKWKNKVSKNDQQLRDKVTREAQKLSDWLLPRLRPDQQCGINPALETRLSREEARILLSWIAPAFKGRCFFVWNPVGPKPGTPPAGYAYSEGHGPSPKFEDNRCIANPDGHPPEDGDWEAYFRKYKNCFVTMGWDQNDNCIFRGQAGRIDPRQRQCRKDTSGFKPIGKGMRAAQIELPEPPPWSSDDDISLAGCIGIHRANDNDGGFVWKQSHVPGYHGVVLFPARFGKFDSVAVRKHGKPLGNVKYAAGPGFPDQAAGNRKRPIWRTSINLKDYPFNVAVRGRLKRDVKDAKGKVVAKKGLHCWPVSNPKVRND